MHKAGLLVVMALLLLTGTVTAQDTGVPVITLTTTAGFDGLFRENEWLPLRIRVSNEGDSLSGRLVVRPETSGNAFINTFSTPVDLPTGSRQTVFLYITARSFASQVRVELLDNDNLVIASTEAPLRGVITQDQLHVVLTQSSVGSVDLSSVHAAGTNAFQANWLIDDLPEQVMGLRAVDTLLFSDIDTGSLSASQQQAVADWVLQGGHLIVTGGANWQATASGLTNLLPLVPDTTITLDGLAALSGLANNRNPLSGETVVATGTLIPSAQVLAAEGETPLVARRSLGLGTVDYLAVDPLTQPLRGWSGQGDLWFTLASSVSPYPGWTAGFTDPDRAISATEILPGFDLLPNVLPLCGFLAFYVALIGPLNYIVLNRINRREFAWLTIPIFILIFSVLAWVVGFNLRGNTATLSRLAVVQSWPDSDQAQVDGLVGLLSPRRTNYTLTLTDGGFLRPIGRTTQSNPFASSVQASTDIRQATTFRADDFLVDASFIATFTASATIPKPAISGQATLFYDRAAGQWQVRGSVRNDTGEALSDPVILSRGEPLRLESALEPGEVRTFSLPLDNRRQPAAPSPLERSLDLLPISFGFQRFNQDTRASEVSIVDIIGSERYDPRTYLTSSAATPEEQERRRRQFFLSALITDHYFAPSRGDRVFLAGWTGTTPLTTDLGDIPWESVDTTLHLVEMEVERQATAGPVKIGLDQFTWVTRERQGVTSSIAPANTTLQPGDEVVFRFTPQPDALLSRVSELRLVADAPSNLRTAVAFELWNWGSAAWEVVELEPLEATPHIGVYAIRNPVAYLGAQNAVQIRLSTDESLNLTRFLRVGIEQLGQF